MKYNLNPKAWETLNKFFKKHSAYLGPEQFIYWEGSWFNCLCHPWTKHLIKGPEGLFMQLPQDLTEFISEFEGWVDLSTYIDQEAISKILTMFKVSALKLPELHRRDFKKPFLFIFFDTETSDALTIEQQEEFKKALTLTDKDRVKTIKKIRKAAWIYPWVIGYKVQAQPFKYSFWDVDKHKSFIDELARLSEDYSIVLEGHNVQYDIDALQPVFELYGLSSCAKLKDGDFYLTGFAENRQIFLTYLDTYHFFRQNLEKAAGIEKADVPYTLANARIDQENDKIKYFCRSDGRFKEYSLSAYIDYLRKDVEAVERLHNQRAWFIEFVQELAKQPKNALKLAHYSQSALGQWFVKQEVQNRTGRRDLYSFLYRPPVSVENYEIERNSVVGGWTVHSTKNQNYLCKENEAIFKFDMVSMYPTIMIRGIPCGEVELKKSPGFKYITWVVCEPIFETPLKFKKEYKHLSTELWKPYWFNTPELGTRILVIKEIWDLWDGYCSNREEAFKFIRFEYQLRDEYYGLAYSSLITLKKESDKLLKAPGLSKEDINELKLKRTVCKLILNGGYGKLMQKEFDKGIFKIDRDKFKLDTHVEEYHSSRSGIYIAQMGRVYLASTVKKMIDAGYNVLRCDTDSILVAADKNTGLKALRAILGPETGQEGSWSLEGVYKNYYSFNVAKKYLAEPWDSSNTSEVEKGVAFSGISGLPELVRYLAINNRPQYEELKSLLISGKNVLFKDCKTVSFKNSLYGQTMIENIDVYLVEDKTLSLGAIIKIDPGHTSFKVLFRQ